MYTFNIKVTKNIYFYKQYTDKLSKVGSFQIAKIIARNICGRPTNFGKNNDIYNNTIGYRKKIV